MEPTTTTTGATTHGGDDGGKRNVLLGKYELGRLLGCGGFGKVYYARDIRTCESVAVKAVSKQKVEKGNLSAHVKREVTIMRRLSHCHIIRLLEVLATRSKIYFVLEFAKGGELFTKVEKGRFSEDLSRRYFHQLISAVGYCHSQGVYHRDLKLENLLLDENWSLKISDFGLSTIQTRPDQGMLHTRCGTPAYVAPEIIAKKAYAGAKIDIWSCGIILFVLNAGYLPFNDTNLMNLYRKIYRGEFRCPKWFSPDLQRFLGRILDTNPETRITIEEIIVDPWFEKGYNEVKSSKLCDDENEGIRGNSRFLNAFDLISFSPRFRLSGWFDVGEEVETYLSSTDDVGTVAERIEEAARMIDAPMVEVERVKGGFGVRVEGQNGNFLVVIEVHRLTREWVVVEVRRREKDVGSNHGFWEEKLKPRIRHLFFEPGQPTLN